MCNTKRRGLAVEQLWRSSTGGLGRQFQLASVESSRSRFDPIIRAWQAALNASQAASGAQQSHVIAAGELQVPATAVIRLPNATGRTQS
jgi:hypothetical protein